MDNNVAQWTIQSASALLQKLLAEEPEEKVDASLRNELLRACAVLAQFGLEDLNTEREAVPSADVQSALRPDLVKLPRIPGEPQWYALKPKARVEGLTLLGSLEQMRAARTWNKVEAPGVTQQVFDEFLERNYAAADSEEVPRVEAALQVVNWLAPYPTKAPSKAAVEKRLAIRRLLYPMERLTRGFMGRQSELATLRSFVGVLEPTSRVEAVARFLTSSRATRAPLMLTGIGGVGKSTLLSEFIREHVNSPVPFPWIYLDFDNPRLNVATLSTLVDEAVEQLSAQYAGSDWSAVRTEAQQRSAVLEAARYDNRGESRTLVLSDVEFSEQMLTGDAESLAALFASQLRRTMESTELERMMKTSETLPFLIVLDTFEEVQKRGVEMARILWTFLRAMQKEFPRVRIIISGRAPVPEVATYLATPVPLTIVDFDEDSAISFLMNREVPNYETARALYKQVGGNPLNLRLAAHVAKLDHAGKGIEGLKTTSYYIFAAAEHIVQGQLYQRILERLPGEDLQKLAHPGLVVRRITEEIIQDVLAVPCGLGEMDEARAAYLFRELEKQVDLVRIEPDGALRHQQDVRRVMLKMLESERPQQVRQIHERAFAYYQNEKGTAGAIERVYHALQLSKEPAEIRAMWVPEAAESLLSSVEELPASSQLLVYEITQRDPPPELRLLANLEQWERLVETKARQALQYGEYDSAERLLKERDERTPGSALYAIAAVCRMRDGDNDAAEELLNRGIESAEGVNRIDRLAELHRLRGELRERESNYPDANASMALAQQLAMRMGTPVLALQICAERARAAEAGKTGSPPVEGLDEIVKACDDADFASVRLQLRGLFRICGPRSVPLLLKGLRVFKLYHLPYIPYTPSWAEEAYAMALQGRLNEFLQELLEREPGNASIREAVSWILEDALNPNVAARSA